ncbi:MAG TPA: ABC transporter permease [Puia sp.]|uniref:ABC transporter permease n=1 Tax=Puia sp. TaxID=2045100 RepID=UPI002B6AC54C|nr:ABC transporter permease [Puia sp.]HVU97650.1 ABC transporter permease [Puia sp.]
MLKNYIKLALRNLRRNTVFAAINILGLSVGLAACLLIAAWVRDEGSYDRYAHRSKDIYRVNLGVGGTTQSDYPMVDIAVGPGMAAAFPEIETFTRLGHLGDTYIQSGTRQFKEPDLVYVDSNFFEVFTLPFLEGDVHTALVRPNSLVITKAFATKYFGTAPALGKTVTLSNYGVCTITGVIDKIPDDAHFHFEAFLSWATKHFTYHSWTNIGFYTYLRLRPDANPEKLQARFPELVEKYCVSEISRDMGIPLSEARKAVKTFVFSLTPLTDIHLSSNTKYELEANGSRLYVLIFSALALFILLLACANFTNLSTAGAAARSKEVGIRKVMGSVKKQLIAQFLTESVLLTAFSMILAVGIALLILPWFNQVSGKHFSYLVFFNVPALVAAIVLILLVGAAAGIYPAFFLSSFEPIKVLKGTLPGGRRSLLRSGLVVFQFVVSIALIVATLIVYRQLHYMQDKRLGYDKNQVVYIQDLSLLDKNQEAFRQELLSDKRVVNASLSWCVPGSGSMGGTEIYPKSAAGDGRGEIHTNIYNIDYDYVSTLGLQVVKGRNFSRDFPTDTAGGVLINETAAADLGWGNTDPIGKVIVRSGQKEYRVVGVLKDFHYLSVKQKIAPLMLLLGNNQGGMLVKVNTADMSSFLSDIRQRWAGFHPKGPFGYYFLDDRFAHMYTAEQRTGRLFTGFTFIAILIAGLGLFGLAAYMAQQRTKEIGIRKVLGATVGSVLLLVSKEFLLLVGLAFLIAVPVTWWAMSQWLREFAYRTPVSWWIFPLAGVAALVIAILTISFQAAKAAVANPINALRSE